MSTLDITEIINTRDSEMTDFQFLIYKAWLTAEGSDEEKRVLRIAAELATMQQELTAKKVADELLKEAKDVFDGELSLCDDANTPEWIWKWKVRHYFEETDIPYHISESK